jgi:chorismate mutase
MPGKLCTPITNLYLPLIMPDASPPTSLAQLRAEIDAVDERLHALLIERAAIIERVATDGGKSGIKIRPGREAAMVRHRLATHTGSLPPQSILRIWRELFAAALIIEGGQTIAVCAADDGADIVALAREHFGPLTPLRRHRNCSQALADLDTGTAQIAVMPAPSDEDDGRWWSALTARGDRQLSVIAKLPFWTSRAEGTPAGTAFAVAAIRPDPSGHDNSLIVFSTPEETSRSRLMTNLTAAGFTPENIWTRRSGADRTIILADITGLLEDSDPRLAAIPGAEAPAIIIGGYAVPLS